MIFDAFFIKLKNEMLFYFCNIDKKMITIREQAAIRNKKLIASD